MDSEMGGSLCDEVEAEEEKTIVNNKKRSCHEDEDERRLFRVIVPKHLIQIPGRAALGANKNESPKTPRRTTVIEDTALWRRVHRMLFVGGA